MKLAYVWILAALMAPSVFDAMPMDTIKMFDENPMSRANRSPQTYSQPQKGIPCLL